MRIGRVRAKGLESGRGLVRESEDRKGTGKGKGGGEWARHGESTQQGMAEKLMNYCNIYAAPGRNALAGPGATQNTRHVGEGLAERQNAITLETSKG